MGSNYYFFHSPNSANMNSLSFDNLKTTPTKNFVFTVPEHPAVSLSFDRVAASPKPATLSFTISKRKLGKLNTNKTGHLIDYLRECEGHQTGPTIKEMYRTSILRRIKQSQK